jgi:putative acetyltransferase
VLQIRAARDEDIPAVTHVIKSVYDEYGFGWFPDGYHYDLYHLDEAYWQLGDEFYLATWNGEPVGTAALEIFPAVPANVTEPLTRIEGSDCSLERLYVIASARGKRIGQSLTEFIIQRAKDLNRTGMEIWSDVKFAQAHSLYQKLGAQVVSHRLCDDPDQSPEHGLFLKL